MNIDDAMDNSYLKELMGADPSAVSDEHMEKFIREFMDSNLIMLCEVDESSDISGEKAYLSFDDFEDFNIIRFEDDESNEFIPLFTDGEEASKFELPIIGIDGEEASKFELPIIGIAISVTDLTKLLFDNPENYEDLVGIIVNPYNECSVEIPYMALLELFGLVNFDD